MILMLSVRLAGTVHAYLDAYAPTNVLIRQLRAPGGRRHALLVSAVLTVAYGVVGTGVTSIIDSGGPGWLNPLALLCAWNTIKFGWGSVAAAWSRARGVFEGSASVSAGRAVQGCKRVRSTRLGRSPHTGTGQDDGRSSRQDG